jgi:hypothetical protein
MKWISNVIIILFAGIIAVQYFDGEKKQKSVDVLFDTCDSLVVSNMQISANLKNVSRDLDFYKEHYDKVTTKIAQIKSSGFKPDKLLIDIIYRRSYINKAVNVDSLFELSRLETSYGSNNVKGRLGELGWPQMTERRFHAMILYFGGDTTGIRLKDYSDNVTMTDWTFAGYVIAKNSRSHNMPDPSWKRTWNNGKSTGMK